MPSKKQTETAARMGLSFQRQPQAAPASSSTRKPPRERPVRITIDLEPTLHQDVKRWALDNDARLADVTRALFARLLDHPPTAAAIRQALELNRDQ